MPDTHKDKRRVYNATVSISPVYPVETKCKILRITLPKRLFEGDKANAVLRALDETFGECSPESTHTDSEEEL
jgi:hypothetical protein